MTDTTTQIEVGATAGRWDRSPRPWRRFLARVFDNAVIGTALWFLIGFGAYGVSFETGDRLVAFTSSVYWLLLGGTISLMLMIPVQAAMIGLTGGSPGKWLCGIRVRNHDGTRLGFGAALYRELKVWLIGFGAGLPLISLFALVQAHNAVKDSGTAHWDDDNDTVVACLPVEGGRQFLIALAIVVAALISGWGFVERFATAFNQA